MPNAVLLGKGGMLARSIQLELERRALPFLAFDRTQLDLSHPEQIRGAIPAGTELIINAAAYTDVDAAEAHEAEATVINGDAVEGLAERARELNASLLHFSTDYVFSGTGSSPYSVDAERSPVNAYGRSKLKGELALQASGAKYLLVRTSWLYAPWGKNFVRTMLKLVQERPALSVVSDQVGRPTSVESLAAGALELMAQGHRGDFHLTDAGQCSWFEFATAIAREAQSPCQIAPCTSEEFLRPAKRPAYSVLDIQKTESVLGKLPDWRQPLRRTLQALLTSGPLLLALILALPLLACSGEDGASEDVSPPDLDPSLAIVELGAEDVGSLCRWIVERARPVECPDGSRVAHAAKDSQECADEWPTENCSARVEDVTDCFASDPCDVDRVAERCAGLVACSFAGNAGQFTCDDGLTRIPETAVCDEIEDCPDASDETDCGNL